VLVARAARVVVVTAGALHVVDVGGAPLGQRREHGRQAAPESAISYSTRGGTSGWHLGVAQYAAIQPAPSATNSTAPSATRYQTNRYTLWCST
jgi:hypothetical protein